jgi:hypothetical protein
MTAGEKPKADYVGHPAMDPGSYRVEYEGYYRRPGMDGTWCKRMEFWTEDGRQCGAWRWAPAEERP